MKYPKISALVPQGEHFDESAVGEGVWLTANHLKSVEESLANNSEAVNAVQALLDTANGTVQTQATEIETLNTAATENATTISTQTARITELEAEVARLGAQSSGTGSTIHTANDEPAGGEKKPVPSYLDPNSPINQFADKHLKKRDAVKP